MGTAGGVDGDVQVGPAGSVLAQVAPAAVGFLPRQAGRPGVLGGQSGRRVGQRGHVTGQTRVQPGLAEVGRVDRQPLAQGEARLGGVRGEFVDVRPRALGVDVVRGERGDAAPVVDAGPQDQVVLRADQVGRRLDAGLGPEDEPGDGDRGGQVVEFGVGNVAHLGVRLGPEVLHDDFLDAAVLAGDLTDGEDRLGALLRGLADADEDAGGERDVAAAGVLQDAQPDRRVLVRAAEVRGALVGEQAARGRLQHHAHGRGDRLEALEVLPGQNPGIQVREQAGLLEHADRHRPDVGQGVVVAVLVQPFAGLAPAVLRLVAQGEQGFLAAEFGAAAGDGQHLVGLQVQAVQPVRDGRERAVPAAVPAQPGERDEDLARVGDDAGAPRRFEARVPGAARVLQEPVQILTAGVQQDRCLVHVERLAVPGPGQRPAHGRRGGRFGSARSAIPFRLSDLAITRVAAQITHARTLRGKLPPPASPPPGRSGEHVRLGPRFWRLTAHDHARDPARGAAARRSGNRGRTCGGRAAAGRCRPAR